MKKILLFALIGCSELFLSQTTISFEPSEGYEVGDLNFQKEWEVSSWGYENSFEVSDEKSTDGQMSMKIMEEGLPTYNFSTAFYVMPTPLQYNNFSVAFDVNINKSGIDSYYFENSEYENKVYGLTFTKGGHIMIQRNDGSGEYSEVAVGNWEENTWYRIKIIGDQNGVSYYQDDALLGTYPHNSATPIEELRFTKWNEVEAADDYAFVDNIVVGEAMLATNEANVSSNVNVSVYPNPVSNVLNIDSKNKIESVQVFDMNGKLVPVENIDGKVDVRALSSGVYTVSVVTSEGYFSQKFIKQ